MTAFAKLAVVEAKLFAREPVACSGADLPRVLLIVLGLAFPGFGDPRRTSGATSDRPLRPDRDRWRRHDRLRRGAGVPRRIPGEGSAAPAVDDTGDPAPRLLTAARRPAGGRGRGRGRWRLPSPCSVSTSVPPHRLAFGLAFVLAAASIYSVGLVIGAVAKTASAAQGIGMVFYFPMLLFAGVYFPREVMPDGMRTVSDLTPAGAAVALWRMPGSAPGHRLLA